MTSFPVLVAVKDWRSAPAPFPDHVGGIVLRCSNKQVSRIAARRIIAMMQNVSFIRNKPAI